MSDFSELCPLFNTGVYSELSIGEVSFTGVSATMNALAGVEGAKATYPGSLKFDRTVIVTKVYAQKQVLPTTGAIVLFNRHKATGTAAATLLASIKLSSTVTATGHKLHSVRAFTSVALPKTFLAADVIGFCAKVKDTAAAVKCNFIIRYKEK